MTLQTREADVEIYDWPTHVTQSQPGMGVFRFYVDLLPLRWFNLQREWRERREWQSFNLSSLFYVRCSSSSAWVLLMHCTGHHHPWFSSIHPTSSPRWMNESQSSIFEPFILVIPLDLLLFANGYCLKTSNSASFYLKTIWALCIFSFDVGFFILFFWSFSNDVVKWIYLWH